MAEKEGDSGEGCGNGGACGCGKEEDDMPAGRSLSILYGTYALTSLNFAKSLAEEAKSKGIENIRICDLETYEIDELSQEDVVVVIISTFTGGTAPPKAKAFCSWLQDLSLDQRGGNLLRNVSFAVFALGDTTYGDNFNKCGRDVDQWLADAGATRFYARGESDFSAGGTDHTKTFKRWCKYMWPLAMRAFDAGPEGDVEVQTKVNPDDSDESDSDSDDADGSAESLVDMEDLGKAMGGGGGGGGDKGGKKGKSKKLRPMLSEGQKASLTKTGYKVIGSHSGVKLCRWTKNMLRGRGGCYKHTCYGIMSFQCMEMTPSMACANKCVFCWRHHKNPVAKEWKWIMDNPDEILDGAMEAHNKMIKELRGLPGLILERWEQAKRIRHCALSLVGEPIIYPEINAFLDRMHGKGISTFLVTNAQFPDEMQTLRPVTQIYISIDAPTKETLKEVDRPIFDDFWERFLSCIDILRTKGQRTVFRLTLVKGWNMEELDNYCQLIRRGRPDFIEIKGVTFTGTGSSLTMKNCPWHHEVLDYAHQMTEMLDGLYEISNEHEHSCLVLLANPDKFKVEGKWHTWIDFDKFLALQAAGEPFTATDYMAETPAWAVYGAPERGFSPRETRWRRKPKGGSSLAPSEAGSGISYPPSEVGSEA
eukprot:TRINITY_DN7509_c0_g1_i1.p1 TRINITY_DN7509_c0_g1~~TRINITY_DN7509_c0_g1_i1.p1  ORF type:complete len:724 (+),score=244.58 TRINITY_DN7509_c0_g1_i1:226-2172(+)